MNRLKTVLNQDGGYLWGGKWGNGMGRVHTVVYVYIVHTHVYTYGLFLKLSDGHTSSPVLFSITFFVLIQHIVTYYEYLLCV